MKAIKFTGELLKWQEIDRYKPECKGVKELLFAYSNLMAGEYLYRDKRIGEATDKVTLALSDLISARGRMALERDELTAYINDLRGLKDSMLSEVKPSSIYNSCNFYRHLF